MFCFCYWRYCLSFPFAGFLFRFKLQKLGVFYSLLFLLSTFGLFARFSNLFWFGRCYILIFVKFNSIWSFIIFHNRNSIISFCWFCSDGLFYPGSFNPFGRSSIGFGRGSCSLLIYDFVD